MKTIFSSLIIAICVGASAFGQEFTNLNFEQAVVQPIAGSDGILLEWELAIPGWSSHYGTNTPFIFLFYRETHLGIEPAYLLVDSLSPVWDPGSLEGAYSIYFRNGAEGTEWVNAFIAQTGLIPADALSVRLLAEGPVSVLINGTEIPLVSLGGIAYGGDISAFAGLVGELKILNTSASALEQTQLIVDAITFSPEAIPEPSTFTLLGLGGVFFAGSLLRRRTNR